VGHLDENVKYPTHCMSHSIAFIYIKSSDHYNNVELKAKFLNLIKCNFTLH